MLQLETLIFTSTNAATISSTAYIYCICIYQKLAGDLLPLGFSRRIKLFALVLGYLVAREGYVNRTNFFAGCHLTTSTPWMMQLLQATCDALAEQSVARSQ